MCYNQTGDISTLDGTSLKLVDKLTYLGSSVSSTKKKNIDTGLTKVWTAIDRLSIIWKSNLTDKMKRCFFQAAVVSILLYGCTTWTLTKLLKKKLDGNYTRMLRAILNKSWRQHSTRHQLYGHLPPITKTIQVRRTRHAGHCWRSKDELISDVLPHMAKQKQDDQLEYTYNSYVRIRDVALKTCQKRWMIERSGERGSGISVLAARHDDDDRSNIYRKRIKRSSQFRKKILFNQHTGTHRLCLDQLKSNQHSEAPKLLRLDPLPSNQHTGTHRLRLDLSYPIHIRELSNFIVLTHSCSITYGSL